MADAQSTSPEFTAAALEEVEPTLVADHTYEGMRRKFIDNGRTSPVGVAERREIVRRFEEVDRVLPIVTAPTDGLILAELLVSTTAEGDVVECGCFAGGSTAKLSVVAHMLGKRLVVFDSFQGLLVDDEYDKGDYHARRPAGWLPSWHTGKYSASLDIVTRNIAACGEISACTFVPGYLSDTLAAANLPRRVALAFTDVDTPSAVRTCLTRIWPQLTREGVYASHDIALMKSLQMLLSSTVWRDDIGEFPPILFGAGFGVCDAAPHMGYFVKGDDLAAEYLKSLTLDK